MGAEAGRPGRGHAAGAAPADASAAGAGASAWPDAGRDSVGAGAEGGGTGSDAWRPAPGNGAGPLAMGLTDGWPAQPGRVWAVEGGRAIPPDAVLHLTMATAAAYVIAEAPDSLLRLGRWGDTGSTCIAAGADGAAELVRALHDEGQADEVTTVLLLDAGASLVQLTAAALQSAAVSCRLLVMGFVRESEAWYGRPEAAAILAAKCWGCRAMQQAERIGFASPWLLTCGADGRRGAGRVLTAEALVRPVPTRTLDAHTLWADASGWAGAEYRVVTPRSEQHDAVAWLIGLRRDAESEGGSWSGILSDARQVASRA